MAYVVLVEQRGRPKVKAESLEPILLAVAELIAERGVAAISMRDAAQAASVSVGRLQHHFGNRTNLMHQAQGWYLHSVIAQITQIVDGLGNPWEKLMRLCARASAGADQLHRARIWIDLLAESRRDPDVRELVAQINDRWCAVIEETITEGVEAGTFHPILSIREVAQILVTFVDGLDVGELTGPSGSTDRDPQLPTMARLLLGLEFNPAGTESENP